MPKSFAQMKAETRSSGGDYVVGGDMASEQIVFGIQRVKWDEGGGYKGADRWKLDIFAWYDGDTLTNDDEVGILSLSENTARNGLMRSIEKEIEVEKEPVGPCVLVRVKTKNGNRYLDMLGWDERTESPIMDAGVEAAPDEDDEPAPPPSRRPSRAPSAPYDNPPSRRTVEARRRAVEAPPEPEEEPEEEPAPRPARRRATESAPQPAPAPRRRAAALPDPDELEPEPEPEPEEAPRSRRPFVVPAEEADQPQRAVTVGEIREWAISEGYDVKSKGKLPAQVIEDYWKAAGEEAAEVTDTPEIPPAVSKPRRAEPVQGDRKATRGVVAADGTPLTPNSGPSAQEILFTPGSIGQSVNKCPKCEQYQEGQMFPSMAGGGPVIIHMCNGDPQVLEAAPKEATA